MSRRFQYYGNVLGFQDPLFWFDYSQSPITTSTLDNIGTYGGVWTGSAGSVVDTGTGVSPSTSNAFVSIDNIDAEIFNRSTTVFLTFYLHAAGGGLRIPTVYGFQNNNYGFLFSGRMVGSFLRQAMQTKPLNTAYVKAPYAYLVGQTMTVVLRYDKDALTFDEFDFNGNKFSESLPDETQNTINLKSQLLSTSGGFGMTNGEIREYRVYDTAFNDLDVLQIKSELDNKWA